MARAVGWLRQHPEAEAIPVEVRAHALQVAGWLLEGSEAALGYREEALELQRGRNDRLGIATSLLQLAIELNHAGRHEEALAAGQEGLPVFEAERMQAAIADSHNEIGQALYGLDETECAETHLQRAMAVANAAADPYPTAMASTLLGLTATEQGDLTRAGTLLQAGLALWRQVGMKEGVIEAISGLATLAVAGRNPTTAAYLFGGADGLAESIGYARRRPEKIRFDEATAEARSVLGDAAFETEWQAGRARRLADLLADAVAFRPGRPGLCRPTGSVEETPAQDEIPTGLAHLTPREIQVLKLLAEGCRDREIAARLEMSPKTAMRHVANIYAKLDVHSRRQAARIARELGLAEGTDE